ncbi:phosphotransferase family protein [Alkaliphilus hydrothermalis]|uniref:Uncharacterized protein (TIGR02172 family) n=1 Tax=Alkaliphilus hydrothermalis TaxID=1482730 RepID=A0ABS2NLI7_9FIRM|nr:aminoglycoside phosphotransferase family protein [Alkaliphilus hydrothermalis]MBM7613788.1 uncharacterized protein (TIGR02172 family) [Alkaliphilus hydrothermalis]
MKKGSLLGKGLTAEVYEYGVDKVLKLFYDDVSENAIQTEAKIGTEVVKAGIAAPAVYGMVEIDGRRGIIFQRVVGKSMLWLIELNPFRLVYYAKVMARLHSQIHSQSTDKLPLLKEKVVSAIEETSHILGKKQQIILDYLKGLPEDVKVCHGDFHPDNILENQGDWRTIDWTNVYIGNPLSDVARTYLMIRSPFMPKGTGKFVVIFSKLIKHILSTIYLKEYLQLTHKTSEDFQQWILPVAAARLTEEVPNEKKWLLNMIDKELKRLRLER